MKTFEDCVRQNVKDLHTRCPGAALEADYAEALHFKRIHLSSKLKELHGYRGIAKWQDGVVVLDARDCARYRSATPYSAPDGKADMSPTGVLAHELGHFFWAYFARLVIKPWRALLENDARKERPITRYAATHYTEDFAESHRIFLLNRGIMENVTPRRLETMSYLYDQAGLSKFLTVEHTAAERKQRLSRMLTWS